MEKFFLVLVFGVGFFLKASLVAGAEPNFATLKTGMGPETLVAVGDINVHNVEEGDEEDDEDEMRGELHRVEEARPARVRKTTIQNNINVAQPTIENSAGGSVAATVREPRTVSQIALIPMIGGSGYQGNWYSHIGNTYSLGLALELMVSSAVALELEGDYGRYNISYLNYQHDFNQYSYGGNAKFYLSRGVFQPFIGVGIMGVTYENMNHGPLNPRSYDQTIGVGQILAGADVALSQSVAIGVRGSYALPMFNRPVVVDDGRFAAPMYEDASAIDSSFYRLMAALKLSL